MAVNIKLSSATHKRFKEAVKEVAEYGDNIDDATNKLLDKYKELQKTNGILEQDRRREAVEFLFQLV